MQGREQESQERVRVSSCETPDLLAFRNSYLVTLDSPHRHRKVDHHMHLKLTDQEAE